MHCQLTLRGTNDTGWMIIHLNYEILIRKVYEVNIVDIRQTNDHHTTTFVFFDIHFLFVVVNNVTNYSHSIFNTLRQSILFEFVLLFKYFTNLFLFRPSCQGRETPLCNPHQPPKSCFKSPLSRVLFSISFLLFEQNDDGKHLSICVTLVLAFSNKVWRNAKNCHQCGLGHSHN